MNLRRCIAAAVFVAICGAGCSLDTPRWFDPGTTQYQQRRAARWDIYPETGLGTDMDGARPREFLQSKPEPTRARWPFWPFATQ